MIKNKIWQMIVFSLIMVILIIVGAVYTSGNKGAVTENGSLTVEGKLGGGILAVLILVWIWSFAIFYPTFKYWRNKSLFLTMGLIFIFTIPLLSIFVGFYYLISKSDTKENIKFIERKVANNE